MAAAPAAAPQRPPSSSTAAATQSEAAAALHEKLLPLALGLHRTDKLAAALQQYKENAAAEVKGAVRDVVQQRWGGAGTEMQLAEQLQVGYWGGAISRLGCPQAVGASLLVGSGQSSSRS